MSPKKAKVSVNGKTIDWPGVERQFLLRGLRNGQTYPLEVTVVVERGNKTLKKPEMLPRETSGHTRKKHCHPEKIRRTKRVGRLRDTQTSFQGCPAQPVSSTRSSKNAVSFLSSFGTLNRLLKAVHRPIYTGSSRYRQT